MSRAVYIPDNERLDGVLASLPPGLHRYDDHARLLLHFVSTKRWSDDLVDGEARLHSLILRHYIPNRVLKPLKGFLTDAGVLETSGYSVGRHSTGYRIGQAFGGPPRRVLLADARLIAKRLAWRGTFTHSPDPLVVEVARERRPILEHMRNALDELTLSGPSDQLARELAGAGVDLNHARYICATIEHNDHDGLTIDPFGLRVHSIVTRTAFCVRAYFRIGGQPLVELDVANAQPLVFAALLRLPTLCTTYVGDAQHIGRAPGPGPGLVLGALLEGCGGEVAGFGGLCERGELYEFLLARGPFGDRETVKRLLYRDVFFDRPRHIGPLTEVSEHTWPGVFRAVQTLKRDFGYKVLARMLQRLESKIMIDGVCGRLIRDLPGLPFLTVHDSVLVRVDSGESVRQVIVEEFQRHGVLATVRKKHERITITT